MNGVYNAFAYGVSKGTIDVEADTLKALLLRSTGAYTFDPDDDFVDDVLTGGGGVEISVASYARETLTTVALTLDDTNDRTKLACDTIGFGSLEVGQTVSAVLIYKEVTNDGDSIPLMHIDGKIKVTAAAPCDVAPTGVITGVTQANPAVVTDNSHGLSNGDKIRIASVVGMTALNGNVYTVANVTANTFELSGIDSTGFGAYVSGGTWAKVMTVYVDPILDDLPSGAAMDFGGGATCTLNGAHSAGDRRLEVNNLAAASDLADDADDVQTTLGLPAVLGGGDFNVNINANGLLEFIKKV